MTASEIHNLTQMRNTWAILRDNFAQDYRGHREHLHSLTRSELKGRLLIAHAKVRGLTARIVTAQLDLEARQTTDHRITLSRETRRWLVAEAITAGHRPLESIPSHAKASHLAA